MINIITEILQRTISLISSVYNKYGINMTFVSVGLHVSLVWIMLFCKYKYLHKIINNKS